MSNRLPPRPPRAMQTQRVEGASIDWALPLLDQTGRLCVIVGIHRKDTTVARVRCSDGVIRIFGPDGVERINNTLPEARWQLHNPPRGNEGAEDPLPEGVGIFRWIVLATFLAAAFAVGTIGWLLRGHGQ